MKKLKEYLERNNYNVVKSLSEVLGIDEKTAKKFYGRISLFVEGDVIAALTEPVTDENVEFLQRLYQSVEGEYGPLDEDHKTFTMKYEDGKYNIYDSNDRVIDTVYSGNEAQNVLHWYNNQINEAEQLNELSPKTLKNYINVAVGDAAHNAEMYGAFGHDNYSDVEKRRRTGINKALDKLSPDEVEVEESKKSDDMEDKRLLSKAAGGGYSMAKELSKGQYQPKTIPNKKHKNHRQDAKSNLKRGMYERRVTPVLESDQGTLKFKLVNSDSIMENQIVLESSVSFQPIGGLTSINGLGMQSLKKLSGIATPEEEDDAQYNTSDIDDLNDYSSHNMEGVMDTISNLDEDTRGILLSILAMNSSPKLGMGAEQILKVKESIREFGLCLQNWIDDSSGSLDFLCPLVDALWVKYNEFCI